MFQGLGTFSLIVLLGFSDNALFSSFMYFVCSMLSLQPDHLVPAATKTNLKSALKEAPRSHLAVARHGPLMGDSPPLLDFSAGTRSQYAVSMYAKLFQSLPATAPHIGSWLLVVCMYRYMGTRSFMDDVIWGTPGVLGIPGKGPGRGV